MVQINKYSHRYDNSNTFYFLNLHRVREICKRQGLRPTILPHINVLLVMEAIRFYKNMIRPILSLFPPLILFNNVKWCFQFLTHILQMDIRLYHIVFDTSIYIYNLCLCRVHSVSTVQSYPCHMWV